MTTIAAFVHGNPEVDAIWGPLVDALGERDVHDVVLLSPPGFGAPCPDGWTATMAEYVGWLVGELERLTADGSTVDLVGHDWGAGHVLGAVQQRSDLVRTFATDVVGLVHPDYEWHDAAQAWQTPEVGEELIDAMVSMSVEDRMTAFGDLGLPADVLTAVSEGIDVAMGSSILGLYRDAVQPAMAQLGEQLARATLPPGLGIIATADSYVSADLGREMIDRLGLASATLEGRGHWWMTEAPGPAADALVEFWNR